MSSTENMLATAFVGFATEIGEKLEEPSMWVVVVVSICVKDERNLL